MGGHSTFELCQSPVHTKHLYHPEGVSLALNSHVLLPSLLFWPLTQACGVLTSLNLSLLATFVLSGLGTWLLLREMGASGAGGLVGGVAFAFCHTRNSALMFPNLAQSHLLPLFAWAAWRLLQRRTWGSSLLLGGFAAALFASSYNLTVLAALWSLLFLLYAAPASLYRHGLGPSAGLAGRALGAAALAALLTLPLSREMARELATEGNYVGAIGGQSKEERSTAAQYIERRAFGAEGLPQRRAKYLGVVVLVLAGWGMVRRPRQGATWFWAAVGLLCLWTALGRTWESSAGLARPGEGPRTPYWWLSEAPVTEFLRVPHRFTLLGGLALAVLAGRGWSTLETHLRHRALRWGGTALACALVFADFRALPFPDPWRVPLPGPDLSFALDRIKSDPRECCVVVHPGGRRGLPALSLYDTLHEKPVYLQGQVARQSGRLRTIQDDSAVFEALERAFGGETLPQVECSRLRPRIEREIREHRIGWLVLGWDHLRAERVPLDHLRRRRRAVVRTVRALFPVDPSFGQEIASRGGSSPQRDLFVRPPAALADWASRGRREQRSLPAVLLVARLRLSAESDGVIVSASTSLEDE